MVVRRRQPKVVQVTSELLCSQRVQGFAVRRAINMLTLTMRREHEDVRNDAGGGSGYARQRSRESATSGDEFVDILQVQQLLLDGSAGGVGNGIARARNPRGGAGNYGVSGAEPPRGRLLDFAANAPPYYYGGYGHHTPPTTSVDDLVALWFAGPSGSGIQTCSLQRPQNRSSI